MRPAFFKLSRLSRKAFTLVELLAVITIISIFAAFVVPSATNMLKGLQLTTGGDLITSQLGFARQMALTKSQPIEVRFYKYGSALVPGESSSNPATGKYRGIQLFQIDINGKATAISKFQSVPGSVLMSSSLELSSVLNQKTRPAQNGATAGNIPSAGNSYLYVPFRFQPDGSTDLTPASQPWFLTLYATTYGDTQTKPPANFYTIQINPYNGNIRNFRP